MSTRISKQVDLERHILLLSNGAPEARGMAILCGENEPILCEERFSSAAAIDAFAIEYGGTAGLDAPHAGEFRVGEGRWLLHDSVRHDERVIARLLLLVEASSPSAALETLRERLHLVTEGLRNESQLWTEADGIADELTQRYEELNFVYSLRNHDHLLEVGNSKGAQLFMSTMAQLMDVKLAAFIVADQPKPIWALGSGTPLGSIDLLLTTLRGHMFRFVSVDRRAVVLNDVDDPRRIFLAPMVRSRLLCCPVIFENRVDAILVLVRGEDQPIFTNGDRNIAGIVAQQTALIMRNTRLVSSLHKFSEQMATSLIEAIEAKDPYTRGHSERVQRVSVEIGRHSDLSHTEIEDISWGSLLHDVGKIGIPDAILCKTGSLTNDEYTVIKTHPETSFEILRHIDYFSNSALEAARYHQEKFDGTGYPHGLRGQNIPLHARIIAVADTYDAITSSRSYREGAPHEVAMEKIEQAAGTQLDPEYVERFVKRCEDGTDWLDPDFKADDGV